MALLSLCMVNAVEAQKTNKVWLDDINIKSFSEGIPAVVAKANQSGGFIKIGGFHYERGVGAQSLGVLSFFLDGNAVEFSAEAGIDDITNSGGTATFYVIGDRKILFQHLVEKLQRLTFRTVAQRIVVELVEIAVGRIAVFEVAHTEPLPREAADKLPGFGIGDHPLHLRS